MKIFRSIMLLKAEKSKEFEALVCGGPAAKMSKAKKKLKIRYFILEAKARAR